MNINIIKLLDPARATRIAQLVKMRKHLWMPRGGFYTIGASTYLDDPEMYPVLAEYTNLALKELWHGLQFEVMAALPRGFAHAPFLKSGTAMMGCHIFTPETNGTAGHPHIDEPYERIDWGGEISNPFSFTLALEMPRAGGGIDYWPDATDGEIDHFMFTGNMPPHEHFRYETGFLYVHDGLTPHRIANCGDMEEGEHRITLQGHGVTLNGRTAVYF